MTCLPVRQHASQSAIDPPPFGLLDVAVSLGAIVLSVIVLLSQNREVERDRVRNDIEYEVNVRSELGVAALPLGPSCYPPRCQGGWTDARGC